MEGKRQQRGARGCACAFASLDSASGGASPSERTCVASGVTCTGHDCPPRTPRAPHLRATHARRVRRLAAHHRAVGRGAGPKASSRRGRGRPRGSRPGALLPAARALAPEARDYAGAGRGAQLGWRVLDAAEGVRRRAGTVRDRRGARGGGGADVDRVSHPGRGARLPSLWRDGSVGKAARVVWRGVRARVRDGGCSSGGGGSALCARPRRGAARRYDLRLPPEERLRDGLRRHRRRGRGRTRSGPLSDSAFLERDGCGGTRGALPLRHALARRRSPRDARPAHPSRRQRLGSPLRPAMDGARASGADRGSAAAGKGQLRRDRGLSRSHASGERALRGRSARAGARARAARYHARGVAARCGCGRPRAVRSALAEAIGAA